MPFAKASNAYSTRRDLYKVTFNIEHIDVKKNIVSTEVKELHFSVFGVHRNQLLKHFDRVAGSYGADSSSIKMEKITPFYELHPQRVK